LQQVVAVEVVRVRAEVRDKHPLQVRQDLVQALVQGGQMVAVEAVPLEELLVLPQHLVAMALPAHLVPEVEASSPMAVRTAAVVHL
jgi:hypothetical protein